MHLHQIWLVVKEALANPVVHGILIGSGIFGAVRNICIVLRVCRKFLSFTKEMVLALFGVVAIIRSPERLVERLVPSWLAADGRTFLPQPRQLLEPLLPYIAGLFILAGTACLVCCSCGRTSA
jgi:hypothetical protein